MGATGLVGGLLADRMLAPAGGAEVHALVRRPTGRAHERWHERVAPASDWPGLVGDLALDAAVSALGTTMRSAGSEAGFRAVDFDSVTAFASAARKAGARHMVTVSSVGADPGSRNFYLRVKGEMEQALVALGFERLDILRPGLLRGDRGGDRRLGERIGIALSPVANLLLRGKLAR
ncbi:MAG: NAD(P)H-binding protein [Allosphingosinicella sp.]